jgi:aspartate dehydrogenase
MKHRIGIIGLGVIGGYLCRKIEEEGQVEVAFLYDADPNKTRGFACQRVLRSAEELAGYRADLVVEVAHPEAVRHLGPAVLRSADLLPFSLTAFSDDAFRKSMEELAHAMGHAIYIPHGAILGLDGIADGRSVLESVRITTVKHPKSLGVSPEGITIPTTLYDGPTRFACDRFPRNVNVHAAIALAGLGFDRTQSTIVADPGTSLMAHMIEVTGKGLRWDIKIESRSVGAVTGAYTPESVLNTVKRLLAKGSAFRLA